jgi:hypothetical protein
MINIDRAKAKAKAKAAALYSKRDEYKSQAATKAKPAADFFNEHAEKVLMGALLVSEILQGESLDNIEQASQVSASVDYYEYTQR